MATANYHGHFIEHHFFKRVSTVSVKGTVIYTTAKGSKHETTQQAKGFVDD